MEPEVLIPMAFLNPLSGQVILAGDPLQLGPVILSPLAKEYGLSTSYLERILLRFPYAKDTVGFSSSNGYDPKLITKLLFNYRSLPVLLKLTSSIFYDDDLIPVLSENGEEAAMLKKLDGVLERCKSTGKLPNVVFHGVVGENLQTPESPSWFNPTEVGQVLFYVSSLYRAGFTCEDIGIISPYVRQVRFLVIKIWDSSVRGGLEHNSATPQTFEVGRPTYWITLSRHFFKYLIILYQPRNECHSLRYLLIERIMP